ncbi:hypothetical protein, partial [Tessaracoccus sp. OH4464_COT-324]|uniref:hypothetical protein n=1 Tax=Tessaracoccus sp. OH4464_COT-324 TaxID=2491059 RepID=UPI001F2C9032
KSRIYIFVATAYYGSGDRHDPELILSISRGVEPHDTFNRNVVYFSDAHYVGRLTCGHDSINGRFSCLAYAEDAFIHSVGGLSG